MKIEPKKDEKLVCPVCGKEFSEETPYIVKGGCTCSWSCFLKRDAYMRSLKENKKISKTP